MDGLFLKTGCTKLRASISSNGPFLSDNQSDYKHRKSSSELLVGPGTAPARLNTVTFRTKDGHPQTPFSFFYQQQQEDILPSRRPISVELPESWNPAPPPPPISIPPSSGVFSKSISATLPQPGQRCAGRLQDYLHHSSSLKSAPLRGSSCPTSASKELSLVNRITGDELCRLMKSHQPPEILDTRKADAYLSCHIRSGRMANCTTRVMMKRTCASLRDFLCPSSSSSSSSSSSEPRVVVVYNDTGDLQGVASSASGTGPIGGTQACLLLSFVEKLREVGYSVHLLDGGITAFRRRHSDLCEFNTQAQSCLYSPTNPDSESSAQDIYNTGTSSILPFLFIGNEHDASSLDQLRQLGITGVINVTSHVKCHHSENGVEYCRLPATDCNSQDMRKYFEEAFKFIDQFRLSSPQRRVLVHCHAGVSRSATIVIAYLMKHSPMNMHEAYNFVKDKRSIISPNFNFLGQLHLFEDDLKSRRVEREIVENLFEEEKEASV